jgi:hypothetical protein
MNAPTRPIAALLILALLLAPAAAEKVVISAQIGLAITNLTVSEIGCDRAAVSWETDRNAAGWVDYGDAPGDYPHRLDEKTPGSRHQVVLTGLPSNSTIYLRACSAWMNLSAYSGEVAFSTLTADKGDDTSPSPLRAPTSLPTNAIGRSSTMKSTATWTVVTTGETIPTIQSPAASTDDRARPLLLAAAICVLLLAAVRWRKG